MKNYIFLSFIVTICLVGCKKAHTPTIQKAKVAFQHLYGLEEGEYWAVRTGIFDAKNKLIERKNTYHPQNLPSIVTKDTVLNIRFYETGDTASFGCCYPIRLPNISVVKID